MDRHLVLAQIRVTAMTTKTTSSYYELGKHYSCPSFCCNYVKEKVHINLIHIEDSDVEMRNNRNNGINLKIYYCQETHITSPHKPNKIVKD